MKPILLLIPIAVFTLGACGGSADSSPAPEPKSPRCEMEADYDAASICPTSQFVVVFCALPIKNPGGLECSPPKGQKDPFALSDTWCCK